MAFTDPIPKFPAYINGHDVEPAAASVVFGTIPTLWSATEREKTITALRKIDPDVDYNEWIRIGQALHSADPDITGGPFDLWDKWSATGSKYKSEADLRQHWRSFTRQGGITLATIYGMAKVAPPIKKAKKSNGKDVNSIPVTTLSDVPEEKIDWLIREVCAAGELTIIAGDGGSGKSTFSAAVMHLLSMGGWSPAAGIDHDGKEIAALGHVMLLAQEEHAGSGLRPRFNAQGTDCNRVHLLGAGKEMHWVRFDDDLEEVEQRIREYKCCALTIDPLTGYLGDTDQNSEAKLREILSKLVEMARRLHIAIIGLMHTNKKIDLNMVDRIMGGVAFKNVSRHVLVMVRDPESAGFRYAVVSKSNIGTEGLAFVVRGQQRPSVLDPDQAVHWGTIEPEVELDQDVDALMRQYQRTHTERHEDGGNMTVWTLDSVNDAGMAGIDTRTLRGVVAQQWLAANEERELPASFDSMLANALSRLARDRRVVRSARYTHRGTPQRYFGRDHAGMADILG